MHIFTKKEQLQATGSDVMEVFV